MATGFTNPIGLPVPATVRQGGTGNVSVTSYAPLAAGSTTTNALVSLSTGLSTTGYVLTSNGSSASPSWKIPTGLGGFTSIVQTINTTPGSYTYTPTTGMVYVVIEVVGGGGAGAKAVGAASKVVASGGGGGGGYARAIYTASDIGASQSYTVGSGGAGSSASSGSRTYFISNYGAGAYLVGNGGLAGFSIVLAASDRMTINPGGEGVSGGYGGSNDYVTVSSGSGGWGISFGSTIQTPVQYIGGQGGNSFYSGSIGMLVNGSSQNGTQGGGGTGAGINGAGTNDGGNGGDGMIIFTEFIA